LQITDYHAKYYAHELTKRCKEGLIVDMEARLRQRIKTQELFAIRWQMV
jgi:hypothetical protein